MLYNVTNIELQKIQDIVKAAKEAIDNAASYAYYGNNVGRIKIKCIYNKNNSVRLNVSDKGGGIRNKRLVREPGYTTAKEGRAGMGFSIMQSLSDELYIMNNRDGIGTTVTMLFKIT